MEMRTSVQRGIWGELKPFHQDALGLTDDVAIDERRFTVLRLAGAGERDSGVGGERRRQACAVLSVLEVVGGAAHQAQHTHHAAGGGHRVQMTARIPSVLARAANNGHRTSSVRLLTGMNANGRLGWEPVAVSTAHPCGGHYTQGAFPCTSTCSA